ncbi:MAG: fdnI [Frankiales bacterium]|nr:fdnI [Frankiales bacterium]
MTPVGRAGSAIRPRPQFTRFSRAERWVHRLTAVLMLVCIGTAAILYNGSLSLAVGHRRQVELIHVYCGFALPVPMILGLVSLAYRLDLRRLNRFTEADWRWLRPGRRRPEDRVGKFNAGQKINSWLSSGSILVLLISGVVMYFVGLTPLAWRTGATFVHDWFALALGLLVIGHIVRAVKDPDAREGMRTGSVSAYWARTEHPGWASEFEDHPPDAGLQE